MMPAMMMTSVIIHHHNLQEQITQDHLSLFYTKSCKQCQKSCCITNSIFFCHFHLSRSVAISFSSSEKYKQSFQSVFHLAKFSLRCKQKEFHPRQTSPFSIRFSSSSPPPSTSSSSSSSSPPPSTLSKWLSTSFMSWSELMRPQTYYMVAEGTPSYSSWSLYW